MNKVEKGSSGDPHVEGQSRRLDAPAARLDLMLEAEQVRRAEPPAAAGHSAKTLAKHPDLRVVLMSFRAGVRIKEHRARGSVVIQTITGFIRVKLAAEEVELKAGSILVLEPSLAHDLEALEESTVLLTLAWAGATQAEENP